MVTDLRFPGQYADSETGLFYNYFRSYQPNQGRYTQNDPIGLDGGWNRFGYVDADPLFFIDPEGLQSNANLRKGRVIDLIPLEGGGGGGMGGGGGRGSSGIGGGSGKGASGSTGSGSGSSSTPQCPPELKTTLDRIKAGQSYPHRNDGSVFQNKEGKLPQQTQGYYREYVHPTLGASGPGAQRVVIGRNGEAYYTPDHYRTFIPVP